MTHKPAIWLLNLPIRKKLSLILCILAFNLAAVIFIANFGLRIKSSVRAYVGGEGLWAKAQKDAVYSLSKYALFGEDNDYQDYLDSLSVPLGDRKARLEMSKAEPDFKVMNQGFLEGKIHPDDIPGMVFLFRRFYWFGPINRAIRIWTEADSEIDKLQNLGSELRVKISSGRATKGEINALIRKLDALNLTLTSMENEFSFTMGHVARWSVNFISWFMILSTILIGGLSLWIALFISRSIVKEVSGISAAATKVATGDLSARAEVNSRDELGQLSRVFNHMAEELARTEQVKNDFLSTVSHELRTPLTLTLAPLESLLSGSQGALSAPQETLLKVMHNNSVRLLQMVNGLLDFSKIEAGKVEVSREPIEIEILTRALAEDFRPIIELRGIELSLEIELPGAPVQMDRYLYERILFNLLSNAIKFTPRGGRITVILKRQKDRLFLIVRDTGMGIPKSDIHNLFQKFRQLDTSSTRRFEGTGLGLALVKEFALLLEGGVSVESEVGKGSAFTVECSAPSAETQTEMQKSNPSIGRSPYLQKFENMQEMKAPASDSRNAGLPKVIIAEDNHEMAAYLSTILKGNCRLTIAEDGNAALELVRKTTPDLVISDVMMPGKDGLTLCREIKSDPATSSIPVILLTALTDRQSMIRGWEAGANDYLFKPFHPKEVEARVRTMLAGERERKRAEKLENSNHELSQFAHVISHDLQEPLRTVASYVQLLEKRYQGRLDQKADEFIHYAVDGASRMRSMIQDLLKYSSVGVNEGMLQSTDCQKELEIALVNLGTSIEESGAQVSHDSLPVVSAYPSLITQIFQNLIANAVKFRGEQPCKIHVGARKIKGEWQFFVSDNGIGIEPRHHGRIFHIFQHLHAQEKYPGTGIGLAICKRIVERHGGRIWFESIPNEGTTFYFTLPE